MLKNEIKNFEKLLKKLDADDIKVFDEIIEMIINLLKTEVSANHDDLMKRVTHNIKFNSMDDIQHFLSSYFNLQNEIIREFESFDDIDDNEFDKKILDFTKTLLQTIPKKDLHVSLSKAIQKVLDLIIDIYKIEICEDEEKTQKSINNAFGNEELSLFFLSTSTFLGILQDSHKISFDETVKLSSSFFIFCMAMNNARKENFINKKNYEEPANEINYNVGRNDSCPCGSGKKYKKCCLTKQQINPLDTIEIKEPKNTLVPLLLHR